MPSPRRRHFVCNTPCERKFGRPSSPTPICLARPPHCAHSNRSSRSHRRRRRPWDRLPSHCLPTLSLDACGNEGDSLTHLLLTKKKQRGSGLVRILSFFGGFCGPIRMLFRSHPHPRHVGSGDLGHFLKTSTAGRSACLGSPPCPLHSSFCLDLPAWEWSPIEYTHFAHTLPRP